MSSLERNPARGGSPARTDQHGRGQNRLPPRQSTQLAEVTCPSRFVDRADSEKQGRLEDTMREEMEEGGT